jgi:hypothetical protein
MNRDQTTQPIPQIIATGARRSAALLVFVTTLLLCWAYLNTTPLDTSEAFKLSDVPNQELEGFHHAETSADGRGFRWSNGDGEITLDSQGTATHVLKLTISAPRPDNQPVPVSIEIDDQSLASFEVGAQTEHYWILVPDPGPTSSILEINSPTFQPLNNSQDTRSKLGIAMFDLTWNATSRPGWIVPAQALGIALAAGLFFLMLQRAGIPLLPGLVAIALLVAISISMRHSEIRFLYRWNALLLSLGLSVICGIGALIARPQPDDGPLNWQVWIREHALALGGYTLISVIILPQLFQNLASGVPGYGDSYEYLWKIQLFKDSLVDAHQTPIYLPWLMYPAGFELANSEMTPANTLLGLPVTWLFGPVVSFNLLLISSYILSAFFTYLLARRLGAHPLAAWVGGIAFGFALRRNYQMLGHLPLMPTQYLPLALYGLEGMLTRRRNWDAFVAAVGLALATWASLYYGPTFALFMLAYALLRLGLRGTIDILRQGWRTIVLAGITLIALIGPFIQPYLEQRQNTGGLKHQLIHLQVHAARLGDYLLTNPNHPIWGDWARQFHRNDGGEHFVALGYSVLILIALGFMFARPRRLVGILAILMSITFVLTLGPDTTLPGGQNVNLPVRFIYDHVPVLNGIRVWNRFVTYISLCAAVIIALLLSRLSGRSYYAATALAGLAIVIEFAVLIPHFIVPGPRPVDTWINAQADNAAVIEVPYVVYGTNVYFAYAQGKPSAMWYGTFDPPIYRENQGLINNFPSPESLALFERWGIGYIVVNKQRLQGLLPEWEESLKQFPQLTLAYDREYHQVYLLKSELTEFE